MLILAEVGVDTFFFSGWVFGFFFVLEWLSSANQLTIGLLSFRQPHICNRNCKLTLKEILSNKKITILKYWPIN